MNSLGLQLKTIRTQKGISQQELAEEAGLSIRTIQRIERGENEPQGFTLRSICEVLGFPPEDLFEDHKVENKGVLQVLHLISVIGLVIPFGSTIAPAIFWLANKNKYKGLDVQAKNLLVSHIVLYSIFSFVISIAALIFLNTGSGLPGETELVLMISACLYLFFSLVYPIFCALMIQFTDYREFYPRFFQS